MSEPRPAHDAGNSSTGTQRLEDLLRRHSPDDFTSSAGLPGPGTTFAFAVKGVAGLPSLARVCEWGSSERVAKAQPRSYA
jgi:hypothetical protein